MTLRKGYVQVYTGNGKGKTTAALGLGLRAVGRGLKVLMIQFMKNRGYGEHEVAERLAPEFCIVPVGKPYLIAKEGELDAKTRRELAGEVVVFPPGRPPAEVLKWVAEGITRAEDALTQRQADVIILDEICVAADFGLVTEADVLRLIDIKPDDVELVMTGRNAFDGLIERADLVTEMKEIKHYYTKGVTARRGIES